MLTANENILPPHKHNRWYAKEKVAKLFEPIVWILFLKHGISKNPLIVNIKMFKKLIISRLLGMGGLGISSPWMDMADSFRLGWFIDKFVVGFRISSWIWKRWLGKPERSKHKKNGYLNTFQAYINKKIKIISYPNLYVFHNSKPPFFAKNIFMHEYLGTLIIYTIKFWGEKNDCPRWSWLAVGTSRLRMFTDRRLVQ